MLTTLRLDFLCALVVLGALCIYKWNERRRRPSYPPGPKPLPIFGNYFDLPKERDWVTYANWAKEYGDIIHVRSFGQSLVILNSYNTAQDLLERRSAIYSDRPHLVVLNELVQYFGTGIQPYGNAWRKHRRLYRKHMDPAAVERYQTSQVMVARELVDRLLTSPRDYQTHTRHAAATFTLGLAYGVDLADKFEHYVKLSIEQGRIFTSCIKPGAFLVDRIPWLKHLPAWFPGASFKSWATHGRDVMRQARDVPFYDVKERFDKGNMSPSFTANSLIEIGTSDDNNEEVQIVKDVAGSIFNAGSDTTSATLEWFLLAMILYPEIQKKAQQELDKVLGPGRLPQFSDRHDLPYTNALVKELFRCFTVTRLGVPHFSTEDDIYEGYLIPAKSLVVGNAWAIMNDPVEYPDPFTFKPERFIPGKGSKVPRDPVSGGALGFGRRICAGKYLADASIWLITASILARCEIAPTKDAKGNDVDVRYAVEPAAGFFSRPPYFPLMVKRRTNG